MAANYKENYKYKYIYRVDYRFSVLGTTVSAWITCLVHWVVLKNETQCKTLAWGLCVGTTVSAYLARSSSQGSYSGVWIGALFCGQPYEGTTVSASNRMHSYGVVMAGSSGRGLPFQRGHRWETSC